MKTLRGWRLEEYRDQGFEPVGSLAYFKGQEPSDEDFLNAVAKRNFPHFCPGTDYQPIARYNNYDITILVPIRKIHKGTRKKLLNPGIDAKINT